MKLFERVGFYDAKSLFDLHTYLGSIRVIVFFSLFIFVFWRFYPFMVWLGVAVGKEFAPVSLPSAGKVRWHQVVTTAIGCVGVLSGVLSICIIPCERLRQKKKEKLLVV